MAHWLHVGNVLHAPDVWQLAVLLPSIPKPGLQLTVAVDGYREDVTSTAAFATDGAGHNTPRHVGTLPDHDISAWHASSALPTRS